MKGVKNAPSSMGPAGSRVKEKVYSAAGVFSNKMKDKAGKTKTRRQEVRMIQGGESADTSLKVKKERITEASNILNYKNINLDKRVSIEEGSGITSEDGSEKTTEQIKIDLKAALEKKIYFKATDDNPAITADEARKAIHDLKKDEEGCQKETLFDRSKCACS